jgi:hypothetical protein
MMSIALSTSFAGENDFELLDVYLINQNPEPTYAGGILEATVGISNLGYGVIENTKLKVVEEYPFTVISENTIDLNKIYSSEDYVITEKIKLRVDSDTKAGDYNLIIEENNENTVIEHLIPISIASNKNVEILSIDKNSIKPGGIENFSFKIKNVGSTKLRNLEFSWQDTDEVLLPVNGDNKVFIESLNIGEEKEVKFQISASSAVTADLYKIDIDLSYENIETSEITIENSNAGIYVGGETDFDIIFDESSESEYVFTVANIGANDASSVKISVNNMGKWQTTGKNAEIIGDLNKGDYTTVSFEFLKNSGDLLLNIDYSDTSGNRITTSKTIEINTESNSNYSKKTGSETTMSPQKRNSPMGSLQNGVNAAGSGLKYLAYGIGALVILFIVYKIYKKKSKNSKK